MLYTVRASFPIIGDPDLHQYINDIGREVLEVAGIQYFDYHFYIVNSSQFNAFAAPSGLIFFYSNLIESMNSEDEFASVIAHEIGHVVRRHLASRMEKGAIINMATLGVALAALALGGGAVTQGLLTGSLAAGQSAQLHFSRQDETEADLLAYKWMRDLNRDTEGQKKMLQTMRRITRYRMNQIPQYLLTHPDPEARLDYVESLISADSDYKKKDDEQKDFAFLRFKYRIMSLNQNTSTMRALLASKVSDARMSAFDVAMARYGLSQVDRQENNLEQSLKGLDQVIRDFPEQPMLLVDKAVVLAEMGNYNEAKILLEKVQTLEPYNMYATFNLAKLLNKLGQNEKSLKLFNRVSYQIPEFSEVYFEMGRILAQQGKSNESRYYLGKFNLYEGKLKLAEANFRQASTAADVDNQIKQDSQEMLALIKRLRKK